MINFISCNLLLRFLNNIGVWSAETIILSTKVLACLSLFFDYPLLYLLLIIPVALILVSTILCGCYSILYILRFFVYMEYTWIDLVKWFVQDFMSFFFLWSSVILSYAIYKVGPKTLVYLRIIFSLFFIWWCIYKKTLGPYLYKVLKIGRILLFLCWHGPTILRYCFWLRIAYSFSIPVYAVVY